MFTCKGPRPTRSCILQVWEQVFPPCPQCCPASLLSAHLHPAYPAEAACRQGTLKTLPSFLTSPCSTQQYSLVGWGGMRERSHPCSRRDCSPHPLWRWGTHSGKVRINLVLQIQKLACRWSSRCSFKGSQSSHGTQAPFKVYWAPPLSSTHGMGGWFLGCRKLHNPASALQGPSGTLAQSPQTPPPWKQLSPKKATVSWGNIMHSPISVRL